MRIYMVALHSHHSSPRGLNLLRDCCCPFSAPSILNGSIQVLNCPDFDQIRTGGRKPPSILL